MKITVETTVAGTLEDVWRAWTTPDDIRQWNAASDDWHTTNAAVDLRVGGTFSSRMEAKDGSMGFDFAGTYTRIVPHELIEYALGDDRVVLVEFTQGANGVTVRETFDAESSHSIEQQRQGWQAILNNFARHVEALSTSQQDQRPPVGVAHVVLNTDRMEESAQFMRKVGMRPIFDGPQVSVYEMRGSTHLILMMKDKIAAGDAPFDLMVDDLHATHKRFAAMGLAPSPIEARPEIEHEVFTVREPAGHSNWQSVLRDQSAGANRLQKVIESGNMKLGQVASDALGVSDRAMLRALAAGETAATAIADLARKSLRRKKPE